MQGGNQMLPAPIIITVTETSISGTACPGCTIEIFSDIEDEGRFYEGTTIADFTGYWILNTDHYLSGLHLTADRHRRPGEYVGVLSNSGGVEASLSSCGNERLMREEGYIVSISQCGLQT